MTKNLFKLSWLFLLALTTIITSCDNQNEETAETVDEFVDEVLFRMEESGSLGRFGCFELVFPITIDFSDGPVTVGDYDELRAALSAWREANPDATERPSFAFPIEVVSEEGEVISVASREDLKALKRACRRSYFDGNGHGGHGGRCGSCFDIVYPISIAFPDGTTTEVVDKEAFRAAIRAWKEANPDAEERPTVVFPIDVELEDGTVVSVNSKEELKELRRSCSEG